MDGDLAPLREIAQLAADHEAMLMVDEAHAVGMYGPNGEGRVRELGLTSSVTLSMGTLSKALRAMAAMSAVPNRCEAISYNTHAPLSIPRHLRLPKWAHLGALDVLEQTPNMGRHFLNVLVGFALLYTKMD